MKILFLPILFLICSHLSNGQHYDEKSPEGSFFLDSPLDENPPEDDHRYDELMERLFNGTPPPINLTYEPGPYDKFIFDPNDDENMSDTYRSLLKLYFHHILNETSNYADVGLEEEMFWKMFKLTAAFLKYQHHLHGNDTLVPDEQNQTHIYNSSEIDTETFLKDMLHYYQGLANKSNESNLTQVTRKPHVSLTSRVKGKVSLIWSKGTNRFSSWWNSTKMCSVSARQGIRNVTRIGAKIVKSIFNKLTGFFSSVPPSVISVQYV